ncbi:MAG: Tfp pilus assembly protein FimT/FimU [Clostridia bacterium]
MNNKGFSLFELLLVLAILTIVISMVSVNVTNIFTNNNLTVVAKELSSDLSFAQQKAIEEGNSWKVEFDDKGYSIFSSVNPNNIIIEKSFTDKNVILGDEEGNFNPSNEFIEFTYLGNLTSESLKAFGLHNDDSSLYIALNEATGKVSLQENIPE